MEQETKHEIKPDEKTDLQPDLRVSDMVKDLYNKQFGDVSKKDKKKKSILERKFRLPLVKAKKGYVSVLVLKPTGNSEIQKLPIIDNFIKIKAGTYHVSSSRYIWNLGKIPFMILPEWDMVPLDRSRVSGITEKTGTWSNPQKLLIHFAEISQVKEKKQLAGKKVFLIIIGAIVVLYLLNSILGGG